MLLILPFNPNHKPLYEHIVALGGDGGHDLLLVGSKSQARAMEDAVDEFTKVFAHVDVFAVDGEPSRNRLFSETVKWLDLVANEAPFYWFEDSVPVRASWLDDIYREYRIKQTPYLGAVEPSVEVDPATGKKFEESPRLMAASIYPADLYQRSTLVRQLCFRGAPAWNVQMRFEIRREATVSAHIQMIGGAILPATSVITGANDPTILQPKKEKDHARK
jgi:hypothetical protein